MKEDFQTIKQQLPGILKIASDLKIIVSDQKSMKLLGLRM